MVVCKLDGETGDAHTLNALLRLHLLIDMLAINSIHGFAVVSWS